MSDSTKKSAWESLASQLGISPGATPPPPPPAPAAAQASEPSSGTPSSVSMRSAPKASWQNLAEFFGLASTPAGAPPAQRSPQAAVPPAPAASTQTPPPAQSHVSPRTPIRDEPLLLSPLAADTYKFEVVEETEIEFGTFARVDAEPDEPAEASRELRSNDSGEPSGDRKRRRRRRRRRGGRSDSAASGDDRGQGDAPSGRDVARPYADRSSYHEHDVVEAELVDDLDSPHYDQPQSEEDLDAIEEAARREDLGLPPLSNRPTEPRRGRRRRRGRRGGSGRDQNRRVETPRTPVPDGVAHGDEYDILDDSADLPSFGDRPYGTDQLSDHGDHAEDHHDHLDSDGDASEPLEALHRNIHTWEQTVGTIIAKNMESRTRSPGNPNQRGRGGRGGRSRGRGGRGRGGGGGGR